jgi:hypothetical protein
VCSILINTPANRNDFVCTLPWGSGGPGVPCTGYQDCQNYMCLAHYDDTATLLGQVCTPACATVADCPAPFTACEAVAMPRPQAGTGAQSMLMCAL